MQVDLYNGRKTVVGWKTVICSLGRAVDGFCLYLCLNYNSHDMIIDVDISHDGSPW